MPRGVTLPFKIQATVTNTNRDVIALFKDHFGGYVGEYQPSGIRSHHRRAWKWLVQCQKAAAFLRVVTPFLVVKRAEAELALAMQDTIDRFKRRPHAGRRGQEPLPTEEIAYRDGLHARLVELRRPVEILN